MRAGREQCCVGHLDKCYVESTHDYNMQLFQVIKLGKDSSSDEGREDSHMNGGVAWIVHFDHTFENDVVPKSDKEYIDEDPIPDHELRNCIKCYIEFFVDKSLFTECFDCNKSQWSLKKHSVVIKNFKLKEEQKIGTCFGCNEEVFVRSMVFKCYPCERKVVIKNDGNKKRKSTDTM